MIKNIILVLCLLVIYNSIEAQSNRLFNPGFEEHDTCFPAISGFAFSQVNHWSDPNFGSSDYYLKYAFDGGHSCSYRNLSTPPRIFTGFEFPHDGVCYGGFLNFSEDSTFREYIQGSFKTRLDSNKSYAIECYISMTEFYTCTYDLGFYFSDTSIINSASGSRIEELPQFSNPLSNPITTKVGWQRITGSYLSDGNDSFLIIGNFKPHYLHTNLSCPTNVLGATDQSSYMLIDDVAIYDTSLIDTVNLCLYDSVQFNDLWYKTDGLYVDIIGGLPVKRLIQHRPESASYTFIDVPFVLGDTVEIGFMYVCHVDSYTNPLFVCDSFSSGICWHDKYLWPITEDTLLDQVFENIYGCDSTVRYRVRTNDTADAISNIEAGFNALSIYPNPANELLNIKMKLQNNNHKNYTVEVFDFVGQKMNVQEMNKNIASNNLKEINFQLSIKELNDGMYFVHVLDDRNKLVGSGKFVKE